MKEKDLISIIVPVYNTELYIRGALDTILSQTYSKFEVIVVDDGSTDNSPNIIREYAEKDDRIIPVHQENNGVSAARNEGMQHARGEYVVFWDSDDTFPDDALERLHDAMVETGSDCVFGGVMERDVFHDVIPKGAKYISKKNPIDRYDRNIIYTLSVCNKMFRMDVIRKNDLRFRKLKFLEDGDFLLRFIEVSEKLGGCLGVTYRIRIRPFWEEPSATQTGTEAMFEQVTDAVSKIRDTILRMQKSDEAKLVKKGASDEDISELRKKGDILLDTLYYRYVSINLINTFYRICWKNDVDYTEELNNYLSKTLPLLTEERLGFLKDNNPDIDFDSKLPDRDMMAHNPKVSVVIGPGAGKRDINYMLANLYSQRFPSFAVYINSELEPYVEDVYKNRQNLYFTEKTSLRGRDSIFSEIGSDYIICSNEPVYWDYEALRTMYAEMLKNPALVLCTATDKGNSSGISNAMIRTDYLKKNPMIGSLPSIVFRILTRGKKKKTKALVYTGMIKGLKKND